MPSGWTGTIGVSTSTASGSAVAAGPGTRFAARYVRSAPSVVPIATWAVGVPITSSETSVGLASGVASTLPVAVTMPNEPEAPTGTRNRRPPATKKSVVLPSAAAGVASSADSIVLPPVPGTGICRSSVPLASSNSAIWIEAASLWAAKRRPGADSVEVSANETLAPAGPKTSARLPMSAPPTGVPSVSRRKCTTPSAVP